MPEPPIMPNTACVMLTSPLRGRTMPVLTTNENSAGGRENFRSAIPFSSRLQLFRDKLLQRLQGLEVLRRNQLLRNGEIELGLEPEHQIDHDHRHQSDNDQQRNRSDNRGDRILRENVAHQCRDPAANLTIDVLHAEPLPYCAKIPALFAEHNAARMWNQPSALGLPPHSFLNANDSPAPAAIVDTGHKPRLRDGARFTSNSVDEFKSNPYPCS